MLETQDQLAFGRHLAAQPFVDSARVSCYGSSYGGYMSLRMLSATEEELQGAPNPFRTGIVSAPVTAWKYYDTIYTERYMSTPELNPEVPLPPRKDPPPLNPSASLLPPPAGRGRVFTCVRCAGLRKRLGVPQGAQPQGCAIRTAHTLRSPTPPPHAASHRIPTPCPPSTPEPLLSRPCRCAVPSRARHRRR